MLENKLEQEIIELYDSNLVNLFSINEISKKLNKKYPYINKKVTRLIEHNILKKMVVGRSYLCSLNLDNDKTIMMLALNEIAKRSKSNDPELEEFLRSNAIRMNILSVVRSDGMLFFVVSDLRSRRHIEKRFRGCTVVDQEEFEDILFENTKIFTDHVVMYGFEKFFEIIRAGQDELKRIHSPVRY